MKTLGVTGGIGSGKTTVCRLFEKLGARVFYADDEAKRLMETDPMVRSEIVKAFGADSYDADGRLNRAYLAATVFGDPDKVARINAIVHPRVYAAFETAKQAAELEGIELMVKEAALIFESGGDKYLDAVLVVDAPPGARVSRVTERDGVSPAKVLARMNHQMPAEDLRSRADFLIENSGTIDDLAARVAAIFRKILSKEE